MSVTTKPSMKMAQARVRVPLQLRLQPQLPVPKHFNSIVPTVFRPITALGIIPHLSKRVVRLFIIEMEFAACRMLRLSRHHLPKQVVITLAGTGTLLAIAARSIVRLKEPRHGSVKIFLSRGAIASVAALARHNAI